MPVPALLRIGGISLILGVIIFALSTAFHGGPEPNDMLVTMPQYAANTNWTTIHILQFVGQLLTFIGLVGIYRSITVGTAAAVAKLALLLAIIGIGMYAANQGVDAIGIKYVSEQWVNAPAEEKATAFRVAMAVRQIEVGLTSFLTMIFGVTFILFGAAMAMSTLYRKWSGVLTIIVGIPVLIGGVLFTYTGFAPLANNTLMISLILQLIWAIAVGISMWRKAGTFKSAAPKAL